MKFYSQWTRRGEAWGRWAFLEIIHPWDAETAIRGKIQQPEPVGR